VTFRMRLTVNQAVLGVIRELPERAQRNLRRKLQTQLKPELQADVDALMASPAKPRDDTPFEFGTDKSRRFWFVLIRASPDLTDGSHYLRSAIIEEGFQVTVSDRLRENLVKIVNIQPKSTFVYGPWQVAGHRNTGWGAEFERARQELQAKAIAKIVQYWYEAVDEGTKGKG